MITYKEALDKFLAAARVPTETETVPTLYAEGRVLARDVVSAIDVPAWDNAQMDGYCLVAADIAAAAPDSPVSLPLSQRVAAGYVGEPLAPGTCGRIFTGAPIPPGADCVVAQEDVSVTDGRVVFSAPAVAGTWVRRKGGDVRSGQVVAARGRRLGPAILGLIASVGEAYVEVFKPLRVAALFTGDELTMPGDELTGGHIYNSNRYTLRALLKRLGCEIYDLSAVADTLKSTMEALRRAADKADLVITCGGMSVGEEDHIKPAVEQLGAVSLWRVSLKPGKPVALGHIGGVPFVGLPGNPVSVFVTFLLLARPFILRSQGVSEVLPTPIQARADFSWTKAGGRQEFIRVRRNESGGLDLYPTQNSQILSSCAWADGLVDVAPRQRIEPGDIVSYYALSDLTT